MQLAAVPLDPHHQAEAAELVGDVPQRGGHSGQIAAARPVSDERGDVVAETVGGDHVHQDMEQPPRFPR
ncbi:hypothetical protein GCM10027610_107920 [Dactylosporangium cerinum]